MSAEHVGSSAETTERPSAGPAPSPLFSQVRRRIEDYVTRSGLRPGDRLPSEKRLADELGVSRNSVRGALSRLVADGMVDRVHGSGTYLTDVPVEQTTTRFADALLAASGDLPHVVPVRAALERLAAQLAAVRRTDDDIEVLERALAGMAAELAAGTSGLTHSEAFHAAIWRAARNPVLQGTLEGLRPQIERLSLETLATPDGLAHSVVAHRRIVDALIARDARAAADAMAGHIVEAADTPLLHDQLDDSPDEIAGVQP